MPFHPPLDRPGLIARRSLLSNHVSRAGILTESVILISRLPEVGMNDQARLPSRPWRRFLHFSVRGMIVLGRAQSQEPTIFAESSGSDILGG